ncbi:MAG: HAMP domain-containing protein, partial [Caulobacteraceae bacterium]|nr:HAMP domain-containing protein [Caulobacteraceae bacterium]
MSLRLRVVAAIVLVLLFGSLVGTAVAGWRAKLALREELAAALIGGRQTVESALQYLPRSGHPARDLRQLIATFDGNRHVMAALVDPPGRVRLSSRPSPAAPAPRWFAALLRTPLTTQRIEVPVPGQGRILLAPSSAGDVGALWAEFVALSGVLTASLAMGAALIWLTVGRALRPLAAFSAAFVRIGSGDYRAEVRPAGPVELIELGRGVNEMAARLRVMHARTRALEEQLGALQDEERADLARDLHDEIGPHLFAVNVDAAMARRLVGEGKDAEALRRLEAIESGVAHMQRLVRDILGRLRPTELIELGLGAAIGELVAFWRARHPDIAFDVRVPPDDKLAIPRATRETLYRVVQEGLNNAVRHGRPARIDIVVAREDRGGVFARVGDDGAPSGRPEG